MEKISEEMAEATILAEKNSAEAQAFIGRAPMEAINREAMRERERCVQIVWENRGKCASNQAALALMNEINGRV